MDMKNRKQLLSYILYCCASIILILHFIFTSILSMSVFVTSLFNENYVYCIVVIIILIIYMPCLIYLLLYTFKIIYNTIRSVYIYDTNFILYYDLKSITVPFNSIVEEVYFENKNNIKERGIIYYTNLNADISPYLKKGVIYSKLFDDEIFKAIENNYNKYFMGRKKPPKRKIFDNHEIYNSKMFVFQKGGIQ